MFRNYWVVVNDDYNFVQAVAFPEGVQCGLSRGDLRSSKLVEMRGHLRLGGDQDYDENSYYVYWQC